MNSLPADVLTWRLVVTALLALLGFFIREWLKSFHKKLNRMESKLDGVIRYLIQHSENGERRELMKLIGEDLQWPHN